LIREAAMGNIHFKWSIEVSDQGIGRIHIILSLGLYRIIRCRIIRYRRWCHWWHSALSLAWHRSDRLCQLL
jgi:hypothetical protein